MPLSRPSRRSSRQTTQTAGQIAAIVSSGLFSPTVPIGSATSCGGKENLGRFLVLSARAPLDPHSLFEIETKPFEPELAKGDKLRFVLRANPVVSRKTDGSRSRRDDIVMHRLHAVPKGFERAQRRDEIAGEAGRDWLKNQGAKAGFAVETCDAAGYHTLAVPREGKKPIQLGVLDLEGRIEIEDFSAFLPALTRGFGKAKGFGCGLMLIARAR